MARTRLKRIFLVLCCTLVGTVVLVILFISPITKYLIEKYDVRYTGREITMDWAYVNPFTGFVHFSNLKIYESKKDTLFFSTKGVSVDFAILKLLSKTYEISELTFDHPRVTIIQKRKNFNFDDLIARFSPDTLKLASEPVHFNILRVSLKHGEVNYREKIIPIHYSIRDLNLESSGKRWDADTIASTFSFLAQNGKGGIRGDFTINVKTQDYRLESVIRNFNLEIIRQYLWELINYGVFSATLDANIKTTGNFRNPDLSDLRGRFSLNDFHLGKTVKNDYLAFDKLVVSVDEVSPSHQKYLFDSITLSHPSFKYETYDSLDNVEMLFGKNGSNISDITSQPGRFNLVIEIGRYLKKISKNFFRSPYRINRLAITQGDLKYNDFSLSEQFSIGTNSLTLRADSVNRDRNRVVARINSGIQPYGDLSVVLSINPKDSGDFDLSYHLNKIPVAVFNPYLISYTSFPLDRGMLEFNGLWTVREGKIKSANHLLVIDPRLSKRVKNKDIKWIPMPLIMTFVRERGNVIDYEIPITGNLKNPHFGLYNVITDILKNIFIKPVTIPYGIQVKTVQNEIENTLTLKWDMRQFLLRPRQKRFVEKMAKFLEENPEAIISVYPNEYVLKEKEYILFFEAKKKYFLEVHHKNSDAFSREDSINVDKMSIKDPSFMHALKRGVSDTMLFTIQDKCSNFVGRAKVDARYRQLVEERERAFLSLFTQGGTESRVKMKPNEEVTPYNGFSYFKISYPGEIPKSLRKAYEEMDELNDENPRRKYFREKYSTQSQPSDVKKM